MACCQHPCVLQWGSRATRYLPEHTALDRTYTYDGEVLIIGAGASGLAAARVLEQNQIRYSILEATDRLGGRVKEDASLADFPIDLGGEWIHNLPGVLDVVSGTPGLGAQTPLIPWRLETSCNWDGRHLSKKSKLYTDAFAWFFPESKWKGSTWYGFVRQQFAEKVQHRIRYDTAVTEVDYSGERVQVTTAGGERILADRVIMTASIGVLKSGDIKFVPDLSKRRKDAIAAVEFLPGFKLFLKFSEKFYPDMVDCTGFSNGEKSYHDAAFKQGPQHILCLLATGNATEPFYALDSEDKWVAAALEELDRAFDGAASRAFTGDYRLEDWGRKKFTQGTWVVLPLIEQSDLAELNAPLDNKVYFAGELHEEGSRQLGVPGALLSGLATADRLLRQPGR